MKKYLLMTSVAALSLIGITSAYNQQGFSEYNEGADGSMTFSCGSQCAVLLDDLAGKEVLSINGEITGSGSIGYGYLVGQTVYPANLTPFSSETNGAQWSFNEDAIYSQVAGQEGAKVVFLVYGRVAGKNISVSLGSKTFSQRVSSARKNFWRSEALAPYSINLHYGPAVGGRSRPFFASWLIILGTIGVLIYRKRITDALPIALTVALVVMTLGGIRLMTDNVDNTSYGRKHFVRPADEQKRFFDLQDYIAVTQQVRAKLELDNVEKRKDTKCTIQATAVQDWPFRAHWQSVYLRPCELVLTGSMADYTLTYGAAMEHSGEIILS